MPLDMTGKRASEEASLGDASAASGKADAPYGGWHRYAAVNIYSVNYCYRLDFMDRLNSLGMREEA